MSKQKQMAARTEVIPVIIYNLAIMCSRRNINRLN